MVEQLAQQAEMLHQAVTELVQLYQCRDRQEICCYGISVSQCYSLEALDAHGKLTMGALAKQIQVTASTMTRIVDQLVARELVQRWFDAADRRVCCVAITAQGQALLHTIRAELLAMEKEVLEKIAPAARETVIVALQALTRAVGHWRAQHQQPKRQGAQRGQTAHQHAD